MYAFIDTQARLIRTTSQKSSTQTALDAPGRLVAAKGERMTFFYRDGSERVVLATSPVKKIKRFGKLFIVRTKTGTTYVFSENLKGGAAHA